MRLLADALEGPPLVEATTQSPAVLGFQAALVNIVLAEQTLESRAQAVAFKLAHKILALSTVLAGIGLALVDILLAQATRVAQAALAQGCLRGKVS